MVSDNILLVFFLLVGADRQKSRFRADPANKGTVIRTGVWAWSRHPNYFFEWLAWCAWPIMAIDPAGRWSWGWFALLAPVQMFVLLRFVSGVPPNELAMARSRGAAFADAGIF